MNGAILFAGSGPVVILTSHAGLEDPALLERLATKGIRKFIGYPVPISVLKHKYGTHFDVVCHSLQESDDLRVLDFNGSHALELLPFKDFGDPVFHEG